MLLLLALITIIQLLSSLLLHGNLPGMAVDRSLEIGEFVDLFAFDCREFTFTLTEFVDDFLCIIVFKRTGYHYFYTISKSSSAPFNHLRISRLYQ